MEKTQVKKWRPGGRAFVMAALALMSTASFATTGGAGFDASPMIDTARDEITAFFTSTGGSLIGLVLVVGLFFLVVKIIRRVVRGGG